MPSFGASGLTKLPGAVYSVDLVGFATYDVSYSGIVTGSIPFVQGDPADDFPNVVLMSLKMTNTGEQCDHTRVELHYEGKDTFFTTPETSLDISVDFTTSQEPIESHPDFSKTIGGTPKVPLNGAFFDSTTGEFLGFPVVNPDDAGQSPSFFAGVKSYLMPQETFTYNSVETEYPSSEVIGSIGKIFEPPVPLPVLPGMRNWLNTGIRIQNIANVYFRQQLTGMASGPRGWLDEVYNPTGATE